MLNVPVDVTVSLIVLVLDASLGFAHTVLGIVVAVLDTVLGIIPGTLDTLLGVVVAVLDTVLGIIVCALCTVLGILVAILDIFSSTTSRSSGPVIVCTKPPDCQLCVKIKLDKPVSVKDMLACSTCTITGTFLHVLWGPGMWTLVYQVR